MSLSSAPLNQTVVVFVSFFLAPAPGVQIVRGGSFLLAPAPGVQIVRGGIALSCTCSRRSDSEGGSFFLAPAPGVQIVRGRGGIVLSCACSRRSDSEGGSLFLAAAPGVQIVRGGVEGWEREGKIVLSPLRFFHLVLLRYEKLLLFCNGLKITRVNSKY